MKGAGHLVWMEMGQLWKKAEVGKQQGSGKGARPQLRWEDCVKGSDHSYTSGSVPHECRA